MSTADHKRIESLFETFAAAWNRRDAQAMAAFYAEDGALIDPLGQEARGRAAIEALFVETLTGFAQGTQTGFTIEHIRFLKPDVAFVDATQKLSGLIGPEGTAVAETTFHLAATLVKQGDDWQGSDVRPYAFLPPQPT